MPVLLNQRHEAFAQALPKGKTADEAYALAGYASNRKNAWRLKTSEDVRKRVNELSGKAADKAEWIATDRLRMLADIATRSAIDGREWPYRPSPRRPGGSGTSTWQALRIKALECIARLDAGRG